MSKHVCSSKTFMTIKRQLLDGNYFYQMVTGLAFLVTYNRTNKCGFWGLRYTPRLYLTYKALSLKLTYVRPCESSTVMVRNRKSVTVLIVL